LPFAFAGAAVVLASAVAAAAGLRGWLVVAGVLVGVLVVGAAAHPPLRHRLAWQLSAVLWVSEAAVVGGVAWHLPETQRWVAYAYLAAVAWHRYDVVYRLRDTGEPSRPWVTVVTLGTDGRMLVLALLWVMGGSVAAILSWGALLLIAVYAVESALGWRAWARGQDAVRRAREAVG
jgi:hypothetical protein